MLPAHAFVGQDELVQAIDLLTCCGLLGSGCRGLPRLVNSLYRRFSFSISKDTQ